jgi:hypothetical protein
MEHHRCYRVYITKTRSTRISDTVFFQHQYITNPTISPESKVIAATQQLTAALKGSFLGLAVPVPQVAPPLLPQYNEELQPYPGPEYDARLEGVNIILEDKSIANVFCFGAFTDKISGVVYNDLTGNFPPSCRSMAVSASLFCTIMSLTQYWSKPSQMLTTIAFMRLSRRYSNCWKQKDTSLK